MECFEEKPAYPEAQMKRLGAKVAYSGAEMKRWEVQTNHFCPKMAYSGTEIRRF
jgi:hypothetical protein